MSDNKLAEDLAASLERSYPGVREYDAEEGQPSDDQEGIWLPEIDELAEVDE